jgi:hypothetical protein
VSSRHFDENLDRQTAVKNNEVIRLAIDFTQRCETKAPFFGKIRINSNFH